MSGTVDMMFGSVSTAIPLVQSKKLKALAVTGRERMKAMPDLPTIEEAGLKGYDLEAVYFMAEPAKVPAPVLKKLADDVADINTQPDVQEFMDRIYARPLTGGPEEARAFLKTEVRKWQGVVDATGMKETDMNKRRRVALAVLAGLMTSLALPQMSRAAEGYPNRPLRLIAPSSPGGILDITSRIVGKKLSERLGQPVVVENVPGAAGILGMQSLLRAEPDGYTMVMGSSGPNAVNYTLYSKLPYAMSDFAPVARIITMPNALVVNANAPVKTLAEFRDYARGKQGNLSMAVSMIGTSGHLGGELLKNRLEFTAVTVPYKGAAPATNDLVAGQVDFTAAGAGRHHP
ncbi:hypothetical protein G6F65_016437 [Rhizopus arrhizus]|nr:hypothetical protein G6F65_016437 [Rhizopus arrhizus]